jgi:hypothetical protein
LEIQDSCSGKEKTNITIIVLTPNNLSLKIKTPAREKENPSKKELKESTTR